ncbi:MAG: sodium-dependent transporter [Phycisphaerales bacterium]
MATPQDRGQWASRAGFILAAAGSAVGLGNLWKFPYITGENGGGLFVLIYLFCILLVGIPIMMAEIMIGRAAQKQPVGAFHELQGRRTGWASVGWLGVITGFVILSYYIVVAGWAMDFTIKSAVNFTQPIHDEAEIEAIAYGASTSLDEMRESLVETRAGRASRPRAVTIRQDAKPSVWIAYDEYRAALAIIGDDAEARERLLVDPLRRAQVEEAEALLERIAEAQRQARADAQVYYADWSEDEIRREASTERRRAVIFDRIQSAFLDVATDGWTSTFWAAIFMLVTILIVAGGVSSGIERTCRILMPLLFVLILVMVVYGMFKPGFGEAVSFIFKPDITKLQASGVLEALGHAFFTLSLGMGAMITYGSYQRTKEALTSESVTIAGLDTTIALLACLMIFPITFSYGQDPNAGPGLVFMSMPLAFAEIGRGGMLLALLFFGLVVFAALTSSISLLEVVSSYFIDERGWRRPKAVWTLGLTIFAFSIPSAFSLDPNFVMGGWESSTGKNFFDTMDYMASNWMLPLGGLLISIYAGWVMPKRLRDAELGSLSSGLTMGWLLLVRFVAPALVLVVLAQKVGLLDADEFFHGLFH